MAMFSEERTPSCPFGSPGLSVMVEREKAVWYRECEKKRNTCIEMGVRLARLDPNYMAPAVVTVVLSVGRCVVSANLA